MATVLHKAQTLASANLHSMFDESLRTNSLAVIDEYIRQAQDNLQHLQDATTMMSNQVKTLKHKKQEFETLTQKLDGEVDALLERGKEELAVATQRKLNNAQEMAQEYATQHERQQRAYQQFLDTRLRLQAKLTEIRQEREQLQGLFELARAKEVDTQHFGSLDALADVQDADIARIADAIRARVEKPSPYTNDQALPSTTKVDSLLETGQIERQLEARKRRLGLTRHGPGHDTPAAGTQPLVQKRDAP